LRRTAVSEVPTDDYLSGVMGLNRQAERIRQLYEAKFGSVDTPIPQLTAGPASHVYLLDLESILPGLRVELDR
jgi:hypothetical protein